ncbi:hypothetical protein KEJ27_03600 [Candidatus Bathyarchaeota archaeon]|nr:hypothetical protein [Candidatus Bathyarchaeota archaeon]MBS7617997.1 hypothetical protein [Candidatus Bathyarchaeota archaeon]
MRAIITSKATIGQPGKSPPVIIIGEPRLCAHPNGAGSRGPWKLMTNARIMLMIAHIVRVVGLIRSAS